MAIRSDMATHMTIRGPATVCHCMIAYLIPLGREVLIYQTTIIARPVSYEHFCQYVALAVGIETEVFHQDIEVLACSCQ